MIQRDFYIATLIAGYLSGQLTPEEIARLEAWRKESAEHEALFQKLLSKERLARYKEEKNLVDTERGWQEVQCKVRRKRMRYLVVKVFARVAMFVLPLLVGYLLYQHGENTGNDHVVQMTDAEAISPGEAKALLTLDDGKVIKLSPRGVDTLKQQDGAYIALDSATLNYRTGSASLHRSERPQPVYHRIDIPHGGEYKLVLADGTSVHLNAMSSLRYPVPFAADCREVELEGEGYFEVAKNGVPFVVKTRGMRVEVLGTTFNLSAYPDDDAYQATLVNGSVKVVADNGESLLLKPSQQVTLDADNGEMEVRTVDTSFYTSWVQGKINFKDQRLEDIMETLSRWYDMEVSYDSPGIRDLRFGCSLDKHESIEPLLQLLEKTEKVSVKVNGKYIELCN